MGVVSRLKKKGIIKDDELEKDKKKREESLKKSQEELPKASEFRNSLKTSKKTEREEDSDNWFQEKNKSKKLKRVNSNSTLPTKSDFIRKVAKTAVEEGKKSKSFLTRATANIAGFGVDAGLTLRNAEETVMEAAPMTWQWANRKAKELEKSSSSDKVQEFLMRNYELNDYLNQGSTQYDNINKEKQKALDDLVNHGTGLANLKEEDKNTLKSEIMQIMNKHENISMNNSDANTRGEQLDEITKTIEKYMGLNYYDNVVDKTQNVVNTIEEEKQKNVDYATSDLGKKSVEVLGNGLGSVATSAIPIVGQAGLFASSSQQYYNEAKQRGMDDEKASAFGDIMGLVEAGTEGINISNIKNVWKSFKTLGKSETKKIIETAAKQGTKQETLNMLASLEGNSLKDVIKNLAISSGENYAQEFATEYIQEGVATAIDNKGQWNGILKRANESGIAGALTALIPGMAGIVNIGNGNTQINNFVKDLSNNNITKEQLDLISNELAKTSNSSKEDIKETLTAVAEAYQEIQPQNNVTNTQDIEQLPVVNEQNTNSNRLRELAIEEINNSNASQKEKADALDILNQMEEVTSQDVEDIRNFMSNVAELETEASKLKTDGNYKYDETRRKKYMEYKNDSTPYNSKVVDEVLDTIPQNRNGRRTVKQWLQAANEIGNRISDLSNEEIEEIAYKSWFELQPTKNITQYDRETKSTVGFQKLTSDEWINTMNKAVNEARANNQVQNENSNKSSFSYDEINSKISNNSDKNKLTDKGITMTYVHMNNQNTGNYGTMYGQNIEPSGEYMNVDIMEGKNKIPGADYGIIHFDNPLILDHINTGETGWKKTLSEMFNNKTGKELSDAVKKAGYDGIITIDENGYYNEIVNLDGRKNNNTLENRVSGDALLNAQDLIDELKEVGAKVDDNGYVTVYHQTTKENADNIIKTGRMSAKEDGIFFSTSKNATQADGRGDTKIEFKIPVEDLVLDDIFDDNADVRIPLKNSKETIDVSKYLTNEVTNNQENNKQKQLDIIQKNNPMTDDYHTGIRSIEDIKTFDEVINDDESFVYGDFTKEDAEKALKEGKVTVYSSNPIEQGSFVSTSQNMAKDYAGDGKIYSQEVDLKDVAWINGDEGQYAKVKNNQNESIENIQQISSIDIQERLNNEINTAITNKVSKGRVSLGKVTDKIVKKVQSLLGIDVTNRTHVLSDNDIRHIINEHGDPKVELKKGQIPVTGNDIQKIPDIINNYDDIIKGNPNKKGDTIRYIKQYEDGTTYLVEVVPETSKTLNIKTMWKKPTSLANQQEPSLTSKTQSRSISSTSNNSITQSTKNVKNDSTITNNSMQNTENNTQNNILNPSEIANSKKEIASTTPKLSKKEYEKGNKQSSFVSNILTDSQFLNKDLRQEMGKEDSIKYYKGITNAETLEKAYNSLKKGGEKETLNWFSKNEKNTTAEDVTKGWILLKQYQDAGDYQGAVEVAKKMRQMGTNAGQAVQAYNIMSRLTPEGMFYYAQSELNEAYNKMVEGKSKAWIDSNQDKFNLTPEETQTIMDTMREVSNMEDGREKTVKLAQIQKLVSDKIPPSAGQSIKAWMRISMLFNPKTQVRNVLGNAVVLPVNTTADIFSGAIDKLVSKKTGVRTTGLTKEGVKGYATGFGKGLFESYDDFRKGINTRDVKGNRFEIGEGKSFKDKGLGKALNRVDSLLSFSLDAGDRGFYEATFTNSINNQLILNNTTEVTQDMIDIATNEALQRTWQDDNNYTQAVLGIRRILNKANVKGYGFGDVLIPFAKTPANLTKAIVDYSPVGLTKALTLDARKFYNSLNNGQYSVQLQHKFVQSLGKGIAGSVLYVLGYALAKSGIATGEADDDKDVKNFIKNSLGIRSYSLKIGDKSFSYDWAQPVATPLAIMTNYVKYSKDNPNANAIEKAIKSLDIGTEQLLQQSFMESINTVLNGNGTTMENLTKAILDLPARAIPTFSKQIADMIDSTQRTSFEYGKPLQSAKNSVIAKIPFASKTLPASIDTLGNEVKKYGGNNNVWNVMFNPANTNKGKLSKAGEEIYKVYMQTGDTTIFPRTAPYYINNKGEKITMTANQRSEFQKVSGQYVEKTLTNLLNSSDYKKLSDEKKANIINEIVSDSYSKAKYDILKLDSKEYTKLRNTLKNVSTTSYYDYKQKTEGMKKDSSKISVLTKSKYTNKEKQALYENYILDSTNTTYPLIKKFFSENGLNINSYLNYTLQNFESDKKDNGTVKGKSISGSRKKKVYNYINNMDISYTQRLLLIGTQYKLNNTERARLANFVNNSDLSYDEKMTLYGKFKGFKVYKNGTITY